MRVLQVSCASRPFHPGGVADLVHRMSGRLVRLGHAAAIFTRATSPDRPVGAVSEHVLEGVRIAAINDLQRNFFHRYETDDYFNPDVHEPFRRFIKDFAPDLVHFHALQGLGAGLIDVVPPTVPTFLTLHDFWWVCPNLFLLHLDDTPCELRRRDPVACERCLAPLPRLGAPKAFGGEEICVRQAYLDRQLARFTRILAVSNSLRDRLRGFLPDLPMEVCENGIEPFSTVGLHERRQAAAASNGARPLRFGFLGSINPLKGYHTLVEAVSRLPPCDIRVDVYGYRRSLLRRLAHAAPRLYHVYRRSPLGRGLPALPPSHPRIRFHSPFEERGRAKTFARFDVLIVASVAWESFSLVCREALAAGIPVIASRCGGPEEIIRHEWNGLLFDPGDAAGLATAVMRLSRDRGLFRELCDNTRRVSIRTIDEQVNDLTVLYQQALVRP